MEHEHTQHIAAPPEQVFAMLSDVRRLPEFVPQMTGASTGDGDTVVVDARYEGHTQHAFGHLGFTNMLAWADPERALSCAVMTSGKPVVYPEVLRYYGLMQRITSEAPKVRGSEMIVWDPVVGRPDT